MFKAIAITALLLSPVVANAGQTQSYTPPKHIVMFDECSGGNYAGGFAQALQWAGLTYITDFAFGDTQAATDAAIIEWNKSALAGVNGAGPANVIIIDADHYISFTVPVGQQYFKSDNEGRWIFFYKNGCFIERYFIPANAETTAPKPALEELSNRTTDGNSGYINPDADFRALTNGS